eukprot:gene24137-biopygen2883
MTPKSRFCDIKRTQTGRGPDAGSAISPTGPSSTPSQRRRGGGGVGRRGGWLGQSGSRGAQWGGAGRRDKHAATPGKSLWHRRRQLLLVRVFIAHPNPCPRTTFTIALPLLTRSWRTMRVQRVQCVTGYTHATVLELQVKRLCNCTAKKRQDKEGPVY